jgi:hypothetical protein
MSRSIPRQPLAPRNAQDSARKAAQGPLDHDRVHADVAAFCAAGGTIEVLGNTRVLKKIDPSPSE